VLSEELVVHVVDGGAYDPPLNVQEPTPMFWLFGFGELIDDVAKAGRNTFTGFLMFEIPTGHTFTMLDNEL
jgi:hypothetical protein